MRLAFIKSQKLLFNNSIQEIPPPIDSEELRSNFKIKRHDTIKRFAARIISRPVLSFLRNRTLKKCRFDIPFPYNHICFGRWGPDASLSRQLTLLKEEGCRKKGLIIGSRFGGEDVQFWLRRQFEEIQVIDLLYDQHFDTIVTPILKRQFKRTIAFRQASAENLPFEDGVFDFVTSNAVIEHVRNLDLALRETFRVMKPGAYAWHAFGPAYFTFSGDHCIGIYGDEHGYDHLLKDDQAYQQMINDQAFFDLDPSTRLNHGWARMNQFSYLTAKEYFSLFQKYFEIIDLVIMVSPKGIEFRRRYPLKWSTLLSAGLDESDLLIDGLCVILRKK